MTFLLKGIQADEETLQSNYIPKKGKPALNPRSLSLELAKHNHRLAAQLVCYISNYFIQFA